VLDKLVDLIINCLDLLRFWVVLQPYEAGVQTRLGKFIRVLDPGFHWLIPFGVDQTFHEHTVPRTTHLRDQSITTADGKQVSLAAVITFQVRDIKKCLLEVEDADHAIFDSCAGAIAHELATMTWAEILSGDSATDRATTACRKRGFRFGLEVISVQFATLALTKTIRLMQA
jgi:regulator of protease activity HflC (stomatin/prohibitin superfamily)